MNPTVVIRHPKERIAKCSLEPLRGRDDLVFHKAKPGFRFDAANYLLLAVDAPVLTKADRHRPLLILDSTWRLLPKLETCLEGQPIRRSLPPAIRTAYPRTSKTPGDPARGLASVEALYAAMRILGLDDPSLLDGYHWKEEFLLKNAFDSTATPQE